MNRPPCTALVASLVLGSAAALSHPVAAQPTTAEASARSAADAVFERLYTEEWEWRQRELGRVEEGEIRASLPDASAAAQERRLRYWEDIQRQLEQIDPADLSPEARVDYAVYMGQIADLAAGLRFREYEIPLNSSGGFWSQFGDATAATHRTEVEYRQYLSMLSDIPRYFDQHMANMRAGAQRGFIPPRIALEGRDVSIASVAEATEPAGTTFYAPFETMPAALRDATKQLRQEAVTIIGQEVIPAHRKLLSFFRDEYYPAARSTLGAADLPGGEDYYAWKVRQYTTLDQTAEEVHAIGLAEVAAIRARMHEVMEQVEFDGDLAAFLTFLRTDPQFYAETPEDYLKEAAWIAKRFDGIAPDYFGRLPRTRFDIQPFPREIAPYTSGAAGGRTTYWLNTYNLHTRPLYSLAALTLHESAPGHSFQMSIAAENEEQPDFRRQIYISAFGEGWALYTEKLGVEMGMYETPYDVFGMLSYQMWRAARLVVDTGIHAKDWSRDQAIQYLVDNTAIGEYEIATEVDRYITNPGQAVSYYTGQMAIERLRRKAEAALGPQFDIRHFHDTILALGSVPLPVLEEQIDQFIARGGPSPYENEEG